MNEHYSIKSVSDPYALICAFNSCKKGVSWKEQVQKYDINLLRNTYKLQQELDNGEYQQLPFYEFQISERGKTRLLRSPNIRDRVVHKSICDNVLTPLLDKYLIYDNGASIKGKGLDFSRRRLDTHLHKYYEKNHTNEGYILTIDFSKYFDNINHQILINDLKTKLQDDQLIELIIGLLHSFDIDVSYLSDEQFLQCYDEIFDNIKYHETIDKSLLTGEKIMEKSLGIGSQISQNFGTYFPSKIDTYCKNVLGIKYYGRYMDDLYIIHSDKEYLKKVFPDIKNQAAKLGVHVNERKSQIHKLKSFVYLKTFYLFSKTGKITHKMKLSNVTRERRKLKKLKILVDTKVLSANEAMECYKSWRGNVIRYYDEYYMIQNMDKLAEQLFGISLSK